MAHPENGRTIEAHCGRGGHIIIRQRSRAFTLIELMIVVAIIGILASIAVPNLLKYQARSRQSEVKLSLRAYSVAAAASYAEYGTYVCGFCDWDINGEPTHYSYYMSATAQLLTADPCTPTIAYAQTPPTAAGPGSYTAVASGNIDSDATCDEWSISPPNVIRNPINDVDE